MRSVGIVKWFNNKDGFGFVTLSNGEHSGKDIFVHFSSLSVKADQYTYLVQGEYVELDLTKPEKGDHEFHGVNVSGIMGGPLMCETRKLNMDRTKTTKKTGSSAQEDSDFQKVSRRRRPKPSSEKKNN
jgi:CspA family cold shock protein